MKIRRAFADLSVGQVHYAECGAAPAPPVLLLHQSPRSWTEYREVLPLLGQRYRAIAMDTVGFGDSAPFAIFTSRCTRVGGTLAFLWWPMIALVALRGGRASTRPICTAS